MKNDLILVETSSEKFQNFVFDRIVDHFHKADQFLIHQSIKLFFSSLTSRVLKQIAIGGNIRKYFSHFYVFFILKKWIKLNIIQKIPYLNTLMRV